MLLLTTVPLGERMYNCKICGLPIIGDMIGCGDGTGQDFAHPDCYWEAKYIIKCVEMKALEENYLDFLDQMSDNMKEIHEKQSENRLLREQITVQITDLTKIVRNMGNENTRYTSR